MVKKFTNRFDPFVPVKMSSKLMEDKTGAEEISSDFNDFISDFEVPSAVNSKFKVGVQHIKEGFCVLITKKAIGKCNGLGEKLLEDFIFYVSDLIELPEYIIFMNDGVFLLCDENNLYKSIMKMKKNGVRIMVSMESLSHFNLSGNVKGMTMATSADISEKIVFSKQLINI